MIDLLSAASVVVRASGAVRGTVAAPASKSLTNRVLLVAALAEGTSRISSPLDSDDADAMRGAIAALGAGVTSERDTLVIAGTAGRLRPRSQAIDARLSGTTMRFVTAAGTLSPAPVTVTGDEPLRRRPIGPLAAALRSLGATVDDADGYPPVSVGGGLPGGQVTVDVTTSSQYASAVLLAAPYAAADVWLTADGPAADAYIALTVALMRRWGAQVDDVGTRAWRVAAGVGYRAREEAIEYDASAAAHLCALAVATGGSVTVSNATTATLQPDAQLVDVLAQMGATVATSGGVLSVEGPARPAAVTVDLSAMPDQVTTVAALAALAHGTSRITGVAVTRGHETDRLTALAVELRKLGATVIEQPDGLEITGGDMPATTPDLDTYDDHRLAMAFAAAGARVGARIRDPGCVAKTYPRFWHDAASLGLQLEATG